MPSRVRVESRPGPRPRLQIVQVRFAPHIRSRCRKWGQFIEGGPLGPVDHWRLGRLHIAWMRVSRDERPENPRPRIDPEIGVTTDTYPDW